MRNMNKFNEEILSPLFSVIQEKPERRAFFIAEKYYTYRQLGQVIAGIRQVISDLKIEDPNVALVVNDDLETYASIIALWMEGKGYVPLHPRQPLERCMEIVSQVHCSLIFDSSENSRYKGQVVRTMGLVGCTDALQLKENAPGEGLAYILFTSGSTGKPKGVSVSRENLAAFVRAFHRTGIQLTQEDRCLQCFDLTFDVSVESFLVPLLAGACVYTVPHDQIKWSYVYGLLEDHKITFGAMAPSMLRYLRPYFAEMNLPDMRYCILTAEASPYELVREWSLCVPQAVIYDFYGPTEATIYCTYYSYDRSDKTKTLNGLLSIGKPMEGVKAIILDESKNCLAAGEKGELCIAGEQLTPGYWENPEKNEEAFFEFRIDGKDQRFYHTGDLCYIDEDGDIMYAGRLDFQAKIQGYRVELGEIEYHVREFLKGTNAVALAYENKHGNTEIGLVIEKEKNGTTDLIAFLKTKLPAYMLPGKIEFLPVFPLNTNSKVDRKALKELF